MFPQRLKIGKGFGRVPISMEQVDPVDAGVAVKNGFESLLRENVNFRARVFFFERLQHGSNLQIVAESVKRDGEDFLGVLGTHIPKIPYQPSFQNPVWVAKPFVSIDDSGFLKLAQKGQKACQIFLKQISSPVVFAFQKKELLPIIFELKIIPPKMTELEELKEY